MIDHDISEFEHLRGKMVQFFSKKTPRQRNWKPGFVNRTMSIPAYDYGRALAIQEQYHDWTFKEYDTASLTQRNGQFYA